MDNSIQIDLIKKHKNLLENKEIEEMEEREENNVQEYAFKRKIKILNFFLQNEIKISTIVKKIPYFYDDFNILIDIRDIKLANINNKIIEEFDLKKDEKYMLCRYNNEKSINFTTFIFNLPTPKLFIFHILDSYKDLLTKIIKLNESRLCFFNLSAKNVYFSRNYTPMIKNFEKSLLMDDLTNGYISTIIEDTEDFIDKPLEVHVLFYLIKNDEITLSYTFIESICDNYVNQLNILDFFSENYRNSYKNACIESLKKYINKPKKLIIQDILQYVNTWDNYSLSILYLYMFCNTIKVFSLQDTFMNKMLIIFLKNIDPEPFKRETLSNTLFFHNKLYNDNTEWRFINAIHENKMKEIQKSFIL